MTFRIGTAAIGGGAPPVVIAEIGINHGGSLAAAKEIALSAVENGAHLIKHQTHFPFKEMSREAESRIPGNDPRSIFDIMKACALKPSEEEELAAYVRDLGGTYFSTPFSREAADFLESIGVEGFKIGSGECSNYPFVEYIASKGLPVILSTGMNSLSAVDQSVNILQSAGVPFALMHTTNLYPTPHRLLRLGSIAEMKSRYPFTPIGLSDHSTSNAACLAAVALGAELLERHFTDSIDREGPDIICSMNPGELQELTRMSAEIFSALGGEKGQLDEEKVTVEFAFASVASTRRIQSGEELTTENCFPMRPNGGDFGPVDYPYLLGRKVVRTIEARTQLSKNDLEELT